MSDNPSKLKRISVKLNNSKPFKFLRDLFTTHSTHDHSPAETFGMEGESIVHEFLKQNNIFAVFSKITTQPEKDRNYRETDAIIFHKGYLCCVEIKRYKGSIEFDEPKKPKTNYRYGSKKNQVPEYECYYKIKVTKEGKYGEGSFEKIHSNPKLRVKSYIICLNNYLKKINSPLSKENFHNLVVFIREDSSIDKIHSFEDGIIYHDEIPKYLDLHSNANFSDKDATTIMESLKALPTWDTIITKDNQQFYGILENDGISCSLEDSKSIIIPYASTEQISIHYNSRFKMDDIEFFANNKKRTYKIEKGWFPLERFGKTDYFKTNSIKEVFLGANPLRRKKIINIVAQ